MQNQMTKMTSSQSRENKAGTSGGRRRCRRKGWRWVRGWRSSWRGGQETGREGPQSPGQGMSREGRHGEPCPVRWGARLSKSRTEKGPQEPQQARGWGSVCQEFGAGGPYKAKAGQASHCELRWAQGAWHRCGVPRQGQRSVVSPYWAGQQDQRQHLGLCGGKRGRALVANPPVGTLPTQQGQRAEESPRRWREPLQEMPKPQPKWGSTCGRGDPQSRRSFLAHQPLNAPSQAEPGPPQPLVARAFTLPPPRGPAPRASLPAHPGPRDPGVPHLHTWQPVL